MALVSGMAFLSFKKKSSTVDLHKWPEGQMHIVSTVSHYILYPPFPASLNCGCRSEEERRGTTRAEMEIRA